MSTPQLFMAALPFWLFLLLLLAMFRHPGADAATRRLGGFLAFPLVFVALSPRLSLGAAATPGDVLGYYVILGVGLVLIIVLFGRSDLE